MMKRLQIGLVILMLLPLVSWSQTYSYKYQVSADSNYMSAKNLLQSNPLGQYAFSIWRERMYSNFYYEGYATQNLVYYKWDLSRVNMTDTTRFEDGDTSKDHSRLGHKKTSIVKFQYDKEISFLVDRNKKVQYYIVNDSIEGVFSLSEQKFVKTEETKKIGEWLCVKWLPSDPSINNKVAVWISNSIPQEINLGIFNKSFKGGIARIEWSNGRYNQLMNYEPVKTPYSFKSIHSDRKPVRGMDLLKASVGDDFTDSFYEDEKFGDLK